MLAFPSAAVWANASLPSEMAVAFMALISKSEFRALRGHSEGL